MKAGSRVFSAFGAVQVAMAILIGVALWLAFEPWRWGRVKEEVRQRFPNIQRISGDELSEWLTKPASTHPLLLDARSEAEYNTSHLPGARRAVDTPSQLGIEGKLDRKLVVYCRVGFESPAIAQSYINRGYMH